MIFSRVGIYNPLTLEPGASHMYSNDLILVSNRKEITKKYIFHMFGATHICTFLSFFVLFYNQDLEPRHT